MNKKFLNALLVGALFFGSAGTFVSCKDYDDEIDGLEQKVTNLNTDLASQKESLTSALTAAQTEASAARSAADAARTEAEKAAALATSAAAEAKAEAISEVMKQVDALIGQTVSPEEVATLAGTVEGIQKGLNTLDNSLKELNTEVDAQAKAAEAMQVQLAALEKFEKSAGEDLTTIKADLASVQRQLANLGSTEEVEKMIKEANEKLTEALGGEISTLRSVIVNRLTSTTLIPKLYIDGIPAIEFRSVKYNPKRFDNGRIVNITPVSDVIVSNGQTKAYYHLNPTGVDEEDIDMPVFISNVARTRAAESENTPVRVDSYQIDRASNVLTVWASKTITGTLELPGNEIYTVALKTPLNDNVLMDGESKSYVYSEYARLTETTISPVIAANPYTCGAPVNHYNDSLTIYGSVQNAMIDKTVDYKAGIDLNTLVTGCYVDANGHNHISTAELKSYGLEFRFAVAQGAYVLGVNGTNQQAFASVDATGKLTSKIPSGVTDNEAAVDKEPIIRVVLWDRKNGHLVDQKYIKLKFTKDAQPAVPLGPIGSFTETLGCDDIDMYFSWDEMTNQIYGKMNNGAGMSKEDFHKIYTQLTFSGNGTLFYGPDVPSAGTYALMWRLTPADIATIAPAVSKDYTINATYSDPRGLNGDVTFSFQATIQVVKPSINGYYDQYWSTKYSIYPVYPVHYDPDVMGTGTITARCEYDNNLMNAFTFAPNGFIIKDLSNCGTWDMQFTTVGQLAGFKPGYTGSQPDPSTASNIGGYNLYENGTTAPAATLVWPAGHSAWCGNVAHHSTNITLDRNNGGKDLVGKKIKVGVWAKVNAWNLYEVKTYDLDIIVPLHINNTLTNGKFYDGVYSGSIVSCAEAFTMTDFRGYIVAKTTSDRSQEKTKYAEELYQYYDVQVPEWDTQNAKIGMKNVNGSLVVDDNLTAAQSIPLRDAYANASITTDPNGNLVFKNNSGSNVEEPCNIFVKATVTYGWGTAEEWVKIRLYPAQ